MTPRRSVPDWILEILSVSALLAAVADVAHQWSALPARIPIHFDAHGIANGWGDRKLLLLLLATNVAAAILLTAAESYQRLINIPIRVDRDSPEVRRLLRSMVLATKAVMTVAFWWITDRTMRTALGQTSGLGGAFPPLFILAILAPIVYYIVRLKRL